MTGTWVPPPPPAQKQSQRQQPQKQDQNQSNQSSHPYTFGSGYGGAAYGGGAMAYKKPLPTKNNRFAANPWERRKRQQSKHQGQAPNVAKQESIPNTQLQYAQTDNINMQQPKKRSPPAKGSLMTRANTMYNPQTGNQGNQGNQPNANQYQHFGNNFNNQNQFQLNNLPPPPQQPMSNQNQRRNQNQNLNQQNNRYGGIQRANTEHNQPKNQYGIQRANTEQMPDKKINLFKGTVLSTARPTSSSLAQKKVKFKLPDTGISEQAIFNKYVVGRGKIGAGAFSQIKKVLRRSDNEVFALKMVKKKGKSRADIKCFQKEITILSKIDHENIIKLYDWCDTKQGIYIVIEYCDGGDVMERMNGLTNLSEEESKNIVYQTLHGIKEYQKYGIVHRDLKLDNLMYSCKDLSQAKVKIIDFGLAGDLNYGPLQTTCGTLHYSAPEVVAGKGYYGIEADMWSVGVIAYMLLSGFPPFFDLQGNDQRLMTLIRKCRYQFGSPYFDHVSKVARDFISKCLVRLASKRITAIDAINHEWFTGMQPLKSRKKPSFGTGVEVDPLLVVQDGKSLQNLYMDQYKANKKQCDTDSDTDTDSDSEEEDKGGANLQGQRQPQGQQWPPNQSPQPQSQFPRGLPGPPGPPGPVRQGSYDPHNRHKNMAANRQQQLRLNEQTRQRVSSQPLNNPNPKSNAYQRNVKRHGQTIDESKYQQQQQRRPQQQYGQQRPLQRPQQRPYSPQQRPERPQQGRPQGGQQRPLQQRPQNQLPQQGHPQQQRPQHPQQRAQAHPPQRDQQQRQHHQNPQGGHPMQQARQQRPMQRQPQAHNPEPGSPRRRPQGEGEGEMGEIEGL